ncbi:MAG: response regulator [candidate division Zixibacteria bacterium]|nr:response regulator [Candidatus Tariuqbacter arcticus]
MFNRTLIIDDNRRYTKMLQERLEQRGCKVEKVLSARDSIKHFSLVEPNHYQIIFTDITMETQVSGIYLTYRIRRRLGFKGCLIIYSTGFNFPIVLWISRLFFRALGADGLIPKRGLIDGRPRLAAISKHPFLKFVGNVLS